MLGDLSKTQTTAAAPPSRRRRQSNKLNREKPGNGPVSWGDLLIIDLEGNGGFIES